MSHLVLTRKVKSFDPEQIEILIRAIERTWSVIKYTDEVETELAARKVIARCVLQKAALGEERHLALVNHSIACFSQQHVAAAALSRLRKIA